MGFKLRIHYICLSTWLVYLFYKLNSMKFMYLQIEEFLNQSRVVIAYHTCSQGGSNVLFELWLLKSILWVQITRPCQVLATGLHMSVCLLIIHLSIRNSATPPTAVNLVHRLNMNFDIYSYSYSNGGSNDIFLEFSIDKIFLVNLLWSILLLLVYNQLHWLFVQLCKIVNISWWIFSFTVNNNYIIWLC